jgi:hypothetical protein
LKPTAEAQTWGIPVQDRLELETVSLALSLSGVAHEAESWGTFAFRFAVSEALIDHLEDLIPVYQTTYFDSAIFPPR